MSDRLQATWTIELHADCPSCKEYVDLLLYVDFWDGRNLQVGENKENQEVVCPECGHEFAVDVVY
jgi:C4-type Zn-finger protein